MARGTTACRAKGACHRPGRLAPARLARAALAACVTAGLVTGLGRHASSWCSPLPTAPRNSCGGSSCGWWGRTSGIIPDSSWAPTDAGLGPSSHPLVARHAIVPVKTSKVARPKRNFPEFSEAHKKYLSEESGYKWRWDHVESERRVPDGSRRPIGPVRNVYLNRTFRASLRDAISEEGRGGLYGRYAEEVASHLRDLDEQMQGGDVDDAVVYWDIENMDLYGNQWRHMRRILRGRDYMKRFLRWIAALVDLPVTRIEAVEFTRQPHDSQTTSRMANVMYDWPLCLRQVGGIVHRAWPRQTDQAPAILIESMRNLMDKIRAGGKMRTIVLVSNDRGFEPMLEAAQSEGVTAIRISDNRKVEARYYPANLDFSVPVELPRWENTRMSLRWESQDPLRPDEEYTPREGTPLWNSNAVVKLEIKKEGEEWDRRKFHEWHDEILDLHPKEGWLVKHGGWRDYGLLKTYRPGKAQYDGTWVRDGMRLNSTLLQGLDSALLRNGTEGTRRGRLRAELREALEKDLADLRQNGDEASAAVLWNYEEFKLLTQGPSQKEMLARLVRYFEGYLGMPVGRVEASRIMEPWERVGTMADFDWCYNMEQLGMVTHRVWPPEPEATDKIVAQSIGILGKMAEAKRAGTLEADVKIPRLICIISMEQIGEDMAKLAQRAGISVFVWTQPLPGKHEDPNGRGFYYPANGDGFLRIDKLRWDSVWVDIGDAARDPFIEGVSTPDAPGAVWKRGDEPVPADPHWGRAGELELDSSPLDPAWLPETPEEAGEDPAASQEDLKVALLR